MRLVGALCSPAIRLSQAGQTVDNPNVQVLRVGKFNHPKYGEFEITKRVLAEMKANFDAKIRGVDVAFDYFHKSDEEASGWPTELYLMEDGTELWAKVNWTPVAQRKLAEREIRYFSPDFAFKWEDPESGVVYNNVLFGGGLTNRPFVKEMAAIVASEKGATMTQEELEKQVKKLGEMGEDMAKKHADLQKAHADLQKEHTELKAKMAEMEEDGDDDEDEDEEKKQLKAKLAEAEKKNAEYMEAKEMAEKEAAFTLLLSEGKAVAAQKEAYLKGDMKEFVKLAQPINLEGKGSSAGADSVLLTGEKEDKVLKLAEEKMKADKSLSKIDAISQAVREVK